jgi:MFS family permease
MAERRRVRSADTTFMDIYIDLLRRNINYRNLWLGAVVSQLGDWFNLIAAASLIANLTSSGVAISYLFLARFLPLFVFSPFAGVLADRFDRRRILIASDLLRALIVLGFLLIRDPAHIWLFYLLTTTQFALSAVFIPARTAVIANIVKRDDLVTANALDSFTWSTMLAIGALLGGLVAAFLGNDTAFVVDAMTFLLAAWFIRRVRVPAQLASERAEVSRGGWFDFVDGLRYLRGEPFILAIALVKGGGSLVWGAINVLEVNFAEQLFPLGGDGSTTLGIIYAITGIGTGFGPILLRRWLGDESGRLRWAITIGFWVLAIGILGLSAAPTFAWFGLATLLRTVGSGTVWVFSAALLQMVVPDRFRGRVFAFEFALLTLTQSISIWWAGYAQDYLDWTVREVTAGAGLTGLIVGLLWLLFHLRALSRPLEFAVRQPQPPETRHIL